VLSSQSPAWSTSVSTPCLKCSSCPLVLLSLAWSMDWTNRRSPRSCSVSGMSPSRWSPSCDRVSRMRERAELTAGLRTTSLYRCSAPVTTSWLPSEPSSSHTLSYTTVQMGSCVGACLERSLGSTHGVRVLSHRQSRLRRLNVQGLLSSRGLPRRRFHNLNRLSSVALFVSDVPDDSAQESECIRLCLRDS
jgi:hypothetical protein